MKLLLIHGAGCSPLSWRTFQYLTDHDTVTYSYDVTHPFDRILSECLERLEETGADVVVGHSFGSLVAWHAAERHERVFCGASVSGPWGGSLYADLVEMSTLGMLPTRFFGNVKRYARHVEITRETPPPVPWLNVVTTSGLMGFVPNDGVLTVDSQRSLFQAPHVLQTEMPFTHSEVLHSSELTPTVDSFVTRVAKGLRIK